MEVWQAYSLYGLAWIVFGLLHSILAGPTAKNILRDFLGNKYRLTYNVVSILTFGFAAWLGLLIFSDAPKLEWGGRVKVWLSFVGISGWILLFIAAGGYDMRRFMGLSQATQNASEDEPLRTDGLHRYVRHPLYSTVFFDSDRRHLDAFWFSHGHLWQRVCHRRHLVIRAQIDRALWPGICRL
jgi:protein-S-isoprenylcysteine O-methyltransferase Ste14